MARSEVIIARLGLFPPKGSDGLLRAFFLLYLLDWKSCLDNGRQVSDIEWTKASWGPYSPAVLNAFSLVKRNSDMHGIRKDASAFEDNRIITEIQERFGNKTTSELAELAASTFPLLSSPKGSRLNLVSLAGKYKIDFEVERSKARA